MYIITTISGSHGLNQKAKMVLSGVNVFRYNFSYGDFDSWKKIINEDKLLIKKLNKDVKILVDLPGDKIRLGNFCQKKIKVKKKDTLVFRSSFSFKKDKTFVPVNFRNISSLFLEGDIFTVADGEMGFKVLKIVNKDEIEVEAQNGGLLYPQKTLNIGRDIDKINHLTPKTIKFLRRMHEIAPEWVAFSFVNSSKNLKRAKESLSKRKKWEPKIVSKIESQLGVKNIKDITSASDMLMVARGDLGLNCPIEKLGVYQKKIIDIAKSKKKKVIVSTQILNSMINSYTPSRAEVLDLTNILMDGADGVMFVDEVIFNDNPDAPVILAKKINKIIKEYVKQKQSREIT